MNQEDDILDSVLEDQLNELIELANEPIDDDTISLEEFNENTNWWRLE